MPVQPTVVATDLEGVLVPEIWIAVAERTGIEELRLTTRDIPDYDVLMRHRLDILDERGLRLPDIHAAIDTLEPLPGARAYFDWLRARTPVVILSDTFYEFALPLMAKLGHPTLFCNSLTVDGTGRITGYTLRMPDGKTEAIRAFRSIAFRTVAIGDSYNDTGMLQAADHGILFRAPANVVAEFGQFPVLTEYDELRAMLDTIL
jgi:phosphoserine / homoserine phosphotransferase